MLRPGPLDADVAALNGDQTGQHADHMTLRPVTSRFPYGTCITLSLEGTRLEAEAIGYVLLLQKSQRTGSIAVF